MTEQDVPMKPTGNGVLADGARDDVVASGFGALNFWTARNSWRLLVCDHTTTPS
jgi:hypothetical protein